MFKIQGARKFLSKKTNSSLKYFSSSSKFSSDPLISVNDAYDQYKSNKAVFIDVRDPKLYEESHIPNSRNINEIFSYLSTSDSKGQKEMLDTFEKLFQKAGLTGNEHVITYEDCLKTRFGASCRGYYILKLLGHPNVNVLHGGWESWVNNKYPITSEKSEFNQGTFKAKWDNDLFACKNDVKNAIGDTNKIIVDVRDQDEWTGESSSPYGKDFTPKKGRIPGSVHLFWKDLMYIKNGMTYLKEANEIDQICKEKNIDKNKEIIVYCFKGARASNTLIGLKRAGFTNVKNYFASWNEWSREDLPVDSKVLV